MICPILKGTVSIFVHSLKIYFLICRRYKHQHTMASRRFCNILVHARWRHIYLVSVAVEVGCIMIVGALWVWFESLSDERATVKFGSFTSLNWAMGAIKNLCCAKGDGSQHSNQTVQEFSFGLKEARRSGRHKTEFWGRAQIRRVVLEEYQAISASHNPMWFIFTISAKPSMADELCLTHYQNIVKLLTPLCIYVFIF